MRSRTQNKKNPKSITKPWDHNMWCRFFVTEYIYLWICCQLPSLLLAKFLFFFPLSSFLFYTELIKFPLCIKCVTYKAPLCLPLVTCLPTIIQLFSSLCSSMHACAPKRVTVAPEPHMCKEISSASLQHWARRATGCSSNTQSSERGRGKREKKGSKNMKISSEVWEAASAPAILVQIQHTLMNTNTHAYAQTLLASVSGRDQVEINHRAWLSPTSCPHSATLQRGNITSLLVWEAFWLPLNPLVEQAINIVLLGA